MTGGRRSALAPDAYERLLAIAAAALFVAASVAILRGTAEWDRVPRGVWLHLVTVLVATGLTPIMLLRPRGDRRHRRLGRVWVAAMILTALISLFIRQIEPGGFSWIHVLSLVTLATAPLVWWSARHHRIAAHRQAVRGLVTGALLIAGFFTFPFGRMLGSWLFG